MSWNRHCSRLSIDPTAPRERPPQASPTGGARRFAYTFEGQIYSATLDGLADELEQSHRASDVPWEQLYAVHESELVPVRLTPIHRPNTDAADYMHEAYEVVDDKDSNDGTGRRCFGTACTTIDGGV